MRDGRPYAEKREQATASQRPALNGSDGADTPVAGFYNGKLRGGGVPCGFRIWFGPPHDPHTGEEMDRTPRWQANVNGRYIEIDRVWPQSVSARITQGQYVKFCQQERWATDNAPDSALANPFKKSDLIKSPLYF